MSRLEEQIDINAPAQDVWARLHDVEAYPTFMDGVQRAYPTGSNGAHLDVQTRAGEQSFETVLFDRGNEQIMSWQTQGRPELKGTFAVRSMDQDHSQVQVRVEYEPDDIHDAFGGPKGMAQVHAIEQTVRGDLEQFKVLVEAGR